MEGLSTNVMTDLGRGLSRGNVFRLAVKNVLKACFPFFGAPDFQVSEIQLSI